MKIGFFNRLMMIISALILVCLAAILVVSVTNLVPFDTTAEYLRRIHEEQINLWPTLGSAAFMIILAAALFALAFRRSSVAPKAKEVKYINVGSPEGGQIKIASATLCQMICKNVDEIPGVKDSKAKINIVDDLAYIIVGVSLNQGVIVPEVGNQIQTTTKERIEQLTGLNIKEISVLVNNKEISA